MLPQYLANERDLHESSKLGNFWSQKYLFDHVPRRRPPYTAQIFLISMQFFPCKIVCWRHLEGWRPFLRGILGPPLRNAMMIQCNLCFFYWMFQVT